MSNLSFLLTRNITSRINFRTANTVNICGRYAKMVHYSTQTYLNQLQDLFNYGNIQDVIYFEKKKIIETGWEDDISINRELLNYYSMNNAW